MALQEREGWDEMDGWIARYGGDGDRAGQSELSVKSVRRARWASMVVDGPWVGFGDGRAYGARDGIACVYLYKYIKLVCSIVYGIRLKPSCGMRNV
jgi:hypothetical protein